MTHDRPIRVVGAVIVDDGRILVAQRGPSMKLPGLWEFPGGKIEPGETPESALTREIREELGVSIQVGDHIETTSHSYDFALVELSAYYARIVSGSPAATEHSELRWYHASELSSLDWAPADIPAVAQVRAALTQE